MRNALNTAESKPRWTLPNEPSNALGRQFESRVNLDLARNAIEPAILPVEWNHSDYRKAAMESMAENMIAWQIRINREERGMTQSALAELMGTKQSAISKLEDPEGGDVLVSTLLKAAHAFDCALVVRLVDYAEFESLTRDVRPERLFAAGFASNTESKRERRNRTRQIAYGYR